MTTSSTKDIDMLDWNIPICFPLYHFKLDELEGSHRKVAAHAVNLYRVFLVYLAMNCMSSQSTTTIKKIAPAHFFYFFTFIWKSFSNFLILNGSLWIVQS
jgi:hypothetical protein